MKSDDLTNVILWYIEVLDFVRYLVDAGIIGTSAFYEAKNSLREAENILRFKSN